MVTYGYQAGLLSHIWVVLSMEFLVITVGNDTSKPSAVGVFSGSNQIILENTHILNSNHMFCVFMNH